MTDPLVSDRLKRNCSDDPSGQKLHVKIMACTPYREEDDAEMIVQLLAKRGVKLVYDKRS